VSTPELDDLLEQAIAHVNAGQMEQGRTLLERVLEQAPQNDRAWVWLSGCVEDPMQRRVCLQQALRANPDNQAALDGMRVLQGELVAASDFPPSLLESRLAAIGMGEAPAGTPAPAPEATALAPPSPAGFEDEDYDEDYGEVSEKPPRRRLLLGIAALLVLILLVCVLVARFVALPMLGVI